MPASVRSNECLDVVSDMASAAQPNLDDLFGAQLLREGGVRFRLWAPAQSGVSVAIEGREPLPMHRHAQGWYELIDRHARAGDRYCYVLADGMRVPDPASRYQPDDVHGPSEVIDAHSYAWHDAAWQGRPWHEAVIYEVHVGTFTSAGTWRAAAEQLNYLVSLGITAIELMPCAEFPGQRGWGYDGVLLFAPECSYGRPDDLKYFVDQAHAQGLMVLLDVVYNHFGPEGNYLNAYAPQFFTAEHRTPWGAAINFAEPVIRQFYLSNALYWLREFHFDGLRLDAVHAIKDDSDLHILDELAQQLRALISERPIHLVLENERNQARFLRNEAPDTQAGFEAQWNDDLHHVLHTAITHERHGYYAEYCGDTEKLARALAEGFAYQGEHMRFTDAARGEPCAHLSSRRFIAFLQNHDQVGNRPGGERIAALSSAQALRVATAIYLLLPQIPLLFMGEEWASCQPFPFFCDFDEPLAQAVRDGRQRELACTRAEHPHKQPQFIDPLAAATFIVAKLDWRQRDTPSAVKHELLYRSLLQVRKTDITPLLLQLTHGGHARIIADGAVIITWQGVTTALRLLANLSNQTVPIAADQELKTFTQYTSGLDDCGEEMSPVIERREVLARSEPHVEHRCIWQEGSITDQQLGPWSMAYFIEHRV